MMRDRRGGQLDLFGSAAAPAAAGRGVPTVRVPEPLLATAARVPASVRLGTSSWSFPGWAGIVYGATATPARLARDGLAAYARHPLLRTVGIDRTFYAPLTAGAFAAYARAVPDGFRFLVKAHEVCTTARFPRHERYGAQAGQPNPRFLDAAYAAEQVVAPAVDGLGAALGPVLFQLPPQDATVLGGAAGFAQRLHAFLRALPRGPLYAVELRTPRVFGPRYLAALADAGAVHCLSAHPSMPDLDTQAGLLGSAAPPATVVRWMLPRHLDYESARRRYAPFDRLVDEDPVSRDAIARLCADAAAAGRPAYVIVNNKAEGSAPLSIFRLAERIAALTG